MGTGLTLRLRRQASVETESVLRDTISQCTASFNHVCGVGMVRLNGVELHHRPTLLRVPQPISLR